MIGFIGIGSMGGAIARGLIAAGTPAADIAVTSRTAAHRESFATETGVTAFATPAEVVEASGPGGIVIVAVKPYAVGAVLEEIRTAASEQGTVIVSVAAGISIATLESYLETNQPVVRTMPNVAAAVGASMTALAVNHAASAHIDRVSAILRAIGAVAPINESHFTTFSAIAGCSPAFTYEYIDAMARAAVYNGLPKAEAVHIATQAVLGAAKLLLETSGTGATPASLADSVQSPGGTTVAGIVELERAGFGAAVVRGVQASIDRDAELG